MMGLINGNEGTELRVRFRYLLVAVLVAMTVLGVRLWYLQIIKGEEFRERSESNSLRFRKLRAFRGLIMDARRQVLADNHPAFDLVYVPNRVVDIRKVVDKLEELYEKRGLKIDRDLLPSGKTRPFIPVCIERNIGPEKIAVVEAHALDLPGFVVEVNPVRRYVEGEVMAHLIGYTGEISQEELAQEDMEDFTAGDTVGKAGIEKYLDGYIGGRTGIEQVEVNVVGRVVKSLGRIDPVAGHNVQLTIRADLQKTAWDALGGRAGAVVAMDPRDGSILAMVSSPSFDPNMFNKGISRNDWKNLSRNPLCPLENRAVSGLYPPGSTYKVVVAAAALGEGIIDGETRFFCNGSLTLGDHSYRCWQRHGHGWCRLHRAVVESCDVFFYNLGKLLDVDRLAWYAKQFGLGSTTGIDLPREKPGLIPTKAWKQARLKQNWRMGDSIPVSIGQGYNLVTPLQLAVAYSALANGGVVWRPRIIDRIESLEGKVIKTFPPEKRGVLPLDASQLGLIRRALWGVVNESGGTGRAASKPDGEVAGKTGTSQVVSMPRDGVRVKTLARREDHALFVCFAPYRAPEITVAVIVEHGGHGGSAAAPVAKKVIDAFMGDKKVAREASRER